VYKKLSTLLALLCIYGMSFGQSVTVFEQASGETHFKFEAEDFMQNIGGANTSNANWTVTEDGTTLTAMEGTPDPGNASPKVVYKIKADASGGGTYHVYAKYAKSCTESDCTNSTFQFPTSIGRAQPSGTDVMLGGSPMNSRWSESLTTFSISAGATVLLAVFPTEETNELLIDKIALSQDGALEGSSLDALTTTSRTNLETTNIIYYANAEANGVTPLTENTTNSTGVSIVTSPSSDGYFPFDGSTHLQIDESGNLEFQPVDLQCTSTTTGDLRFRARFMNNGSSSTTDPTYSFTYSDASGTVTTGPTTLSGANTAYSFFDIPIPSYTDGTNDLYPDDLVINFNNPSTSDKLWLESVSIVDASTVDTNTAPSIIDINVTQVGSIARYDYSVTTSGGSNDRNFFWTFEGGMPNEDASATVNSVAYPAPGTYQTCVTISVNDIAVANPACDGLYATTECTEVAVPASAFLPVTFASFTAAARGPNVQLDWRTSIELNNAYFDVQHRGERGDFQTVGRVAGTGTSQQPQDYAFLHRNPLAGTNYYRLLQVDTDGSSSYSPVVTVIQLQGGAGLQIYPNPAQDRLELRSSAAQPLAYELRSTDGRLLRQGSVRGGAAEVDLQALTSGLYLLYLLRADDSLISVEKVIKQ